MAKVTQSTIKIQNTLRWGVTLVFLLFFIAFNATAQNVTFPESDSEKDNWQIINDGNTVRLQYNGNKRVKSVKFAVKYSVTVSAKMQKVSFETDNNLGDVTAKFQTSQIGNLKMTVTGDEIDQSELTLTSIDNNGNGTFEGRLTVKGGSISNTSALNGTITISGTQTSSTSIDDLFNNCAHTYSTVGMTFGGNSVVTLTDQNFYIYVVTYNGAAVIGGKSVNFTNFTRGSYYVFPKGTEAAHKGFTKVLDGGKLYNVGIPVTSISISGGFESSNSNPYVWGSETTDNKTLTVNYLPVNATNKNVTWSSNAINVSVDENGKITITAPNETTSIQEITITATAADDSNVKGEYKLYLANYVQIAGIKWYTYDSQTSVTWANRANGAPSGAAVPSKEQFQTLKDNTDIVDAYKFKVKSSSTNGNSNAYITLQYGGYWSSTEYSGGYAYYLYFDSGYRNGYNYTVKNLQYRVRLVRTE